MSPPPPATIFLDRVHKLLGRRLRAYAVQVVSDRDEAADLLHDLYLRAPEFVEGKPFARCRPEDVDELFRYLCGCLRKLAANQWRKERSRARLLEKHGPPERLSDPVAELYRRFTTEAILEAVNEHDARILRMKHFQGLTSQEMGARLGCSPGAARERLRQAHLRARAAFGI